VLRWILVLLSLTAIGSLVVSAAARREAGELLRDLSDRVVMLMLRTSSGFAADVAPTVQEEERERRLRWR
jgi:hypothetical protein